MIAFIDDHRDAYGVEPICRVLPIAPSTYYEHVAQRQDPSRLSARAREDLILKPEIARVFAESFAVYGVRKVWRQMMREGFVIARCTVERLMRTHGIEGCHNAKTQRTTTPGRDPVAADDLVRRDFSATRPDEIWLMDFTYIRTWEGWSYVAVVLDVFTRRIVGWQMASHMRQSLVSDALEMAIASRGKDAGLTIGHSDNGSQYTSYEYTERLIRAGIAPSRGRTGTALDNAMAESIMSTLKRELTKRYTWRTRLDLELALVTYIGWYNAQRRHRSLKHTADGRTRREAPHQVLQRYTEQTARETVASK